MRSTLRPTGTPYRISVATALGGLSRAIDQNDFACAAGTAAAMAEAQPTLPVPTIPIFIDPSGVDRSQRDVSRSVPGESGSPCRSRLTGDAVDGFFSFERQAWSLVKSRPICPDLICDRHRALKCRRSISFSSVLPVAFAPLFGAAERAAGRSVATHRSPL